MKFTICLLNSSTTLPTETLDTLKTSAYIDKIISILPIKNLQTYHLSDQPLTNEATIRNKMIQETNNQHIIWLNEYCIVNEDFFEEYAELIEESHPDFIYPNLTINNQTKNFSDWSTQKMELIQSFRVEEEIPHIGVYTNKDAINIYDEKFGPYTLYDFIYKNIKSISIRLSELSFLQLIEYKTDTDLSFNSRTLRDILRLYDFKSELFYHLDWKQENIALATAYTLIGNRLMEYNDYYNASEFYRKALLTYHNQESMKNLLYAYYQMSAFEQMKILLEQERVETTLRENFLEKMEKTEELITKLETMASQNRLDISIFDDLLETYNGAYMHNILGAVYIQKGNLEKGYEQLYLAATKNPIDQDILHNLVPLAKVLKKEKEVLGLYDRLLKK